MIASFVLVLAALGDVPAPVVDTPVETRAEPSTHTIVSQRRDLRRLSGSAHIVTEEQLERFEYDDMHRVLKHVPGVYVRDEDGVGLRPNIGMRGVSSDRSAKVVLLEDGVLMGPAPYSAPAAYYFPLTTRMVGVEVFKGPASIQQGPNTVGGAINLVTRPVPYALDAGIDVAAGLYGYGKAHAHVGWGNENFGFLIEGVRVESDGFKEIDRLPSEPRFNSGFERDDLMVKGRLSTSPGAEVAHVLELKLGIGDEDSRETYLGLTEADLRETPYRRYRGSMLDNMRWLRAQGALSYFFRLGDVLDVRTVAYRHDFHRAWRKLNRFRGGATLENVLLNPTGTNEVAVAILEGREDSAQPSQALMIGTNDRTFVSEGIQSALRWRFSLLDVQSRLELGARLHHDRIERLHTEDAFMMTSSVLVPDGTAQAVVVSNVAETLAGAVWLLDELRWGDFALTPGVRVELIGNALDDRMASTKRDRFQLAVMPGVGASWRALSFLDVFAGVHKGFSPVAPGQPAEVLPEESWNTEVGTRVALGRKLRAEVVGFVTPYSNLTGECTFSTGCVDDLNAQFNGGQVLVWGVEGVLADERELGPVRIGGQLTTTFTQAQFQTTFRSESPLFGHVHIGDDVPYVPKFQSAVELHAALGKMKVAATTAFVSAMRDTPGQGAIDPHRATDPQILVDAMASYDVFERGSFYVRVDNATNAAVIGGRRPFGARPGRPLTAMLGYKHSFGP